MLRKLPIVALPIKFNEIMRGLRQMKTGRKDFSLSLSKFTQSKYIYFSSSGIASFYIILKALKEKSKKKEVVLPAYTAGSLVVGVMKAGLIPVLCDISLEDFNLDGDYLTKVVSQDTLAIVCVHMFGIGMTDVKRLRESMPFDVFIIEDCAQSLGSKIDGTPVGNLGDISFFSFNRGKNLPTGVGGSIATNNEELARDIEGQMKNIEEQSFFYKLSIPFHLLMLSLATMPLIYGVLYPLISLFKEKKPTGDFKVRKYTNFQAMVASMIFKRIEELSRKRRSNGMKIIEELKDSDGIIVPQINRNTEPAFNRLPILFKDLSKREEAQKRLWKAGIETSLMYFRPLHHIFDLGYKKEDFPNACYLAEHILTLPVHPLVRDEDIAKILDILH